MLHATSTHSSQVFHALRTIWPSARHVATIRDAPLVGCEALSRHRANARYELRSVNLPRAVIILRLARDSPIHVLYAFRTPSPRNEPKAARSLRFSSCISSPYDIQAFRAARAPLFLMDTTAQWTAYSCSARSIAAATHVFRAARMYLCAKERALLRKRRRASARGIHSLKALRFALPSGDIAAKHPLRYSRRSAVERATACHLFIAFTTWTNFMRTMTARRPRRRSACARHVPMDLTRPWFLRRLMNPLSCP